MQVGQPSSNTKACDHSEYCPIIGSYIGLGDKYSADLSIQKRKKKEKKKGMVLSS